MTTRVASKESILQLITKAVVRDRPVDSLVQAYTDEYLEELVDADNYPPNSDVEHKQWLTKQGFLSGHAAEQAIQTAYVQDYCRRMKVPPAQASEVFHLPDKLSLARIHRNVAIAIGRALAFDDALQGAALYEVARGRGAKHLAHKIAARFLAANSLWYHLTEKSKFKLDPKFAPADNAIAIEDRSGQPGIYIAPNVEKWVNGHGYWRPFVVEFKVDPSVKDDPGVHGRYGGEMFIPATSFGKISIQRVIPIDAYAREEFGEPGWIEGEIGLEFDTGQPIPKIGTPEYKKYRGYRYTGPDVRHMPSTEVNRLKHDLRKVKR